MGWWVYFAAHPDAAAIHDAMFAEQSAARAERLLGHLDLPRGAALVDVGGGYGGLLVPILRARPALRGVIVDLPHAAAGAAERIRAAGLADPCSIVAGDFFAAVPPGDAFLLKNVLRDWDDAHAVAVLRRCREALAPGGRLSVVDSVIPPGNEPGLAKIADDFLMTIIPGGADRTEAQLRALLAAAGFRLQRVTPLPPGPALLEAVPA